MCKGTLMKKLTSCHLAVLSLVSFVVTAPLEAESDAKKLLGRWELDPQASVEDLGGLARWSSASETERDRLRASLEKRAQEMVLEITDEALTLHSGQQEMTFSCSTRYRTPVVVVLGCSTGQTPFTITVVRLTGDRIKLLSSGTDDMDVYVWRRRG